MTLKNLNENILSFITGKSKKKIGFKVDKDGFAHLDLKGYEKVYITKLNGKEGNGYRVFFKAKGQSFKENNIKTIESAVEILVKEINKIIDGAKTNGASKGKAPDRAPADLKKLDINDFDIKNLKREL